MGWNGVLNACTVLKSRGILVAMPAVESHEEAVRRELEKVLRSPGFANNERLSRFLRFVVEHHLEGKDHELKESVLAVEVFGRKPDYNPRQDAIVRTEAGRLRARLSEFYIGEGKDDPLVIELPKGGYAPAFRHVDTAAAPAEPALPAVPVVPAKRKPRRMVWPAALGILALAAGALTWRHSVVSRELVSIGVIPFENLSPDSANEYFADGLTDELIRNLSLIDGLAVRSQTSSFALRGKHWNVHEVGRQLDVDYILEGSVMRAAQQLRINAQFIRVRDDFALWSGKFDKELTDVFAIQEEISRGIVNSLRLKLGRGRRRYETSIEAYDLYLRSRALHARLGLLGYRPSIPLLEEAVRKDPSFAPAYAGLVDSYVRTTGFKNVPDRDDMLARMRAAADRAIQLDPLLAEAHAARAMAYARDANWEQSEKSFRRAIELDPNRSMSRGEFAINYLQVLGRNPEAIQQLRAAQKSDPLSPEIREYLSYGLLLGGRPDQAALICTGLPDDFPAKPECLGRALLGQGKIAEAIQVLAKAGNKGYLGIAYARAGRRAEAEDLAKKIAPNPFNELLIFAGLGDKGRALEALDRFTALGPVRVGRALNYPELASLRGDPRVKAIRRKLGLPQ